MNHLTLADIAGELRLKPSAEQTSQLCGYLDLLERWNATYNLTAVRKREDMLTQHLADCLAVIGPLRSRLKGGSRLLDVGSGAGLPGVVIATLLPECQVTCIDAVAKKAAFVRQVAAGLALPNLESRHGRVEALRGVSFDVIASRAVGPLADLVRVTNTVLAPGGAWMAMKGKFPSDEIKALPSKIRVFHVEPLDVPGLAAERCLVWMAPIDPPLSH